MSLQLIKRFLSCLLCITMSHCLPNAGENSLKYTITTAFEGTPLSPDEYVNITLEGVQGSDDVTFKVEAPFYNDTAPSGVPGMPFLGLWNFEVVEVFFLNDKNQYLEVEIGPHGHHIVLLLNGERNTIRHSLPLLVNSTIAGDVWQGEAKIPMEYFPVQVTKLNAYAIHGEEGGRKYSSLYPADTSTTEPDFHSLKYFKEIDMEKLVENYSEKTVMSKLWKNALDGILNYEIVGESKLENFKYFTDFTLQGFQGGVEINYTMKFNTRSLPKGVVMSFENTKKESLEIYFPVDRAPEVKILDEIRKTLNQNNLPVDYYVETRNMHDTKGSALVPPSYFPPNILTMNLRAVFHEQISESDRKTTPISEDEISFEHSTPIDFNLLVESNLKYSKLWNELKQKNSEKPVKNDSVEEESAIEEGSAVEKGSANEKASLSKDKLKVILNKEKTEVPSKKEILENIESSSIINNEKVSINKDKVEEALLDEGNIFANNEDAAAVNTDKIVENRTLSDGKLSINKEETLENVLKNTNKIITNGDKVLIGQENFSASKEEAVDAKKVLVDEIFTVKFTTAQDFTTEINTAEAFTEKLVSETEASVTGTSTLRDNLKIPSETETPFPEAVTEIYRKDSKVSGTGIKKFKRKFKIVTIPEIVTESFLEASTIPEIDYKFLNSDSTSENSIFELESLGLQTENPDFKTEKPIFTTGKYVFEPEMYALEPKNQPYNFKEPIDESKNQFSIGVKLTTFPSLESETVESATETEKIDIKGVKNKINKIEISEKTKKINEQIKNKSVPAPKLSSKFLNKNLNVVKQREHIENNNIDLIENIKHKNAANDSQPAQDQKNKFDKSKQTKRKIVAKINQELDKNAHKTPAKNSSVEQLNVSQHQKYLTKNKLEHKFTANDEQESMSQNYAKKNEVSVNANQKKVVTEKENIFNNFDDQTIEQTKPEENATKTDFDIIEQANISLPFENNSNKLLETNFGSLENSSITTILDNNEKTSPVTELGILEKPNIGALFEKNKKAVSKDLINPGSILEENYDINEYFDQNNKQFNDINEQITEPNNEQFVDISEQINEPNNEQFVDINEQINQNNEEYQNNEQLREKNEQLDENKEFRKNNEQIGKIDHFEDNSEQYNKNTKIWYKHNKRIVQEIKPSKQIIDKITEQNEPNTENVQQNTEQSLPELKIEQHEQVEENYEHNFEKNNSNLEFEEDNAQFAENTEMLEREKYPQEHHDNDEFTKHDDYEEGEQNEFGNTVNEQTKRLDHQRRYEENTKNQNQIFNEIKSNFDSSALVKSPQNSFQTLLNDIRSNQQFLNKKIKEEQSQHEFTQQRLINQQIKNQEFLNQQLKNYQFKEQQSKDQQLDSQQLEDKSIITTPWNRRQTDEHSFTDQQISQLTKDRQEEIENNILEENTIPPSLPLPKVPILNFGMTLFPPLHPICFVEGLVPDTLRCQIFHECVIENGRWKVYDWRCKRGHYFDPDVVACLRGYC